MSSETKGSKAYKQAKNGEAVTAVETPTIDFGGLLTLVGTIKTMIEDANPAKPKTGNESVNEIVQDESAESTKDYHIVKKYRFYSHLDAGGAQFVSFKLGVKNYNHRLASQIRAAISNIVGSHRAMGDTFELDFLARISKQLNERIEAMGYDPDSDPFDELFDLLDTRQEALKAQLQERLDKGVIELEDFANVFEKGDLVIIQDGTDYVGGEIVSTKFVAPFMRPPYWQVKITSIVHTGDGPTSTMVNYGIPAWSGLKALKDLTIVKRESADPEIVKQMVERGAMFRDITTGVAYMLYAGQIVQHSWYGSKGLRADGRIMVDAGSMKTIDSDRYDRETRAFNVEEEHSPFDTSMTGTKKEAYVIKDEDLWRCSPSVLGFSFRAKAWGTFSVSGISQIQFRDDAFDNLVMEEEHKTLIRALVENSGSSFTDVVEGKGGGCIFLLEGEPGQGKTLTAETVAEVLKRPLYPISVGELGTDPDVLEERLRTILDIARIWNAVLLLDEADIFLEKRDTKDLLRNAMVAVFLRLLEYHDGVLMLTTNRADNIDPAFFSRISVALSFPSADVTKRQKIWKNLLHASGLTLLATSENLLRMSQHDINGRQIKNAIRLGQTLALSEKRSVTIDDMERPLALSNTFLDRVRKRAVRDRGDEVETENASPRVVRAG